MFVDVVVVVVVVVGGGGGGGDGGDGFWFWFVCFLEFPAAQSTAMWIRSLAMESMKRFTRDVLNTFALSLLKFLSFYFWLFLPTTPLPRPPPHFATVGCILCCAFSLFILNCHNKIIKKLKKKKKKKKKK